MNLEQALKDAAEKSRAKIPPEAAKVMAEALDDLRASGIEKSVLKVGEKAPEFELRASSGARVSLKEVLGQGPAVIVFYRGGWCPFCNINLHYLQKHLKDIESAGGSLIAISPESPDNSLSTQDKNDLEFLVLSDPGNKVARQFGLVFRLPPDLISVYKQFGIDLEAHNGESSWELPLAATFILDTEGKVVHRFVDADYKSRMDPVEIVKVLDEIALSRAGIKR